MKRTCIIMILIPGLIISCGEGTVSVTNKSYEPKITIEGFLIPHQKVEKIRIARNFPLDADLTKMSLIPDVYQTKVTITDIEKNQTYQLTFHEARDKNFDNYYWEYNNKDLIIDYGNTYMLEVTAAIDGKILYASSTTTVPQQGFRIVSLNQPNLTYRQRDENGEVMNFELTIERSPGVSFYVTTVNALNPSTTSFIYDNPFTDLEPQDVEDDIIDFSYSYEWLQDRQVTTGQSKVELLWYHFWFYGDYQVIIYAADQNYKEFLQTYNDVQEEDGNFHEPKFNIDGDGIGVFGAMIADTVYVSVLQK